jgi:nicotinate-nucleotide pyrophosphorylase (carboxylating)
VISGGQEKLIERMRQFALPAECTFSPEQLLKAAEPIVKLAAHEDVPEPDLVDARMIIDKRLQGEAVIQANSEGVIAGGWLLGQIAMHYSKSLSVTLLVKDGTVLKSGDRVATIKGPVSAIVMAERVFLNFLSRLSGIATLTWRCAQSVSGTHAVVTDTRKTMPGYRILDKYAVQCGGGKNHRLGLCDGVMIKDNHISAMSGVSGISRMVARVRSQMEKKEVRLPIWVEIDHLEQLGEAMDGRPDVILLDNMSLQQLRTAVGMRDAWYRAQGGEGERATPLLEASGGVDLSNIGDVARTGVDRIAVGALTHSAPALDLGLDLHTASLAKAGK